MLWISERICYIVAREIFTHQAREEKTTDNQEKFISKIIYTKGYDTVRS
jgi:hypothetical protein